MWIQLFKARYSTHCNQRINFCSFTTTAAQEAFADFIQTGHLRADQLTFINNIISYLTKNGTIDKGMLFEPPFTNLHQDGLVGMFDDAVAMRVIKLIDRVNGNALVEKQVAS